MKTEKEFLISIRRKILDNYSRTNLAIIIDERFSELNSNEANVEQVENCQTCISKSTCRRHLLYAVNYCNEYKAI